MSEIYKIILNQKSGLLTELQSDTIFGHLCWRMLEMFGKDILEEFLILFQNNPVFTISNNLFEKDNIVYFPKPLFTNIKKEVKKLTKVEKLEQMCKFKERKSKNFINIESLNFYLSGNYDDFEKCIDKSINIKSFEEHLRTNVQISRDSFSSEDGKLFSYAPKYLNSNISEKEIPVNICLLVKVIDKVNYEKFKCEDLLKEVFEIGYGKKKSSGFGEFDIIDFKIYSEIKEADEANSYMNLSNYLPSAEDRISNAFYDYHVKYGKMGEQLAQSENPFKNPIIFFKPGSVFFSNNLKDYYGRCTENSEISELHKMAVQNGIAFTLKAKLME